MLYYDSTLWVSEISCALMIGKTVGYVVFFFLGGGVGGGVEEGIFNGEDIFQILNGPDIYVCLCECMHVCTIETT